MEIEQHFLHSNRKQVIRLLGHLLDARHAFTLCVEHAKLVGKQSKYCMSIESNIDALCEGVQETVELCTLAAEDFKSQMTNPDAISAPTQGRMGRIQLTRLQRALERDGVNFDNQPTHITPKQQERAPKMFPFTLKHSKPYKKRKRTKENIPL